MATLAQSAVVAWGVLLLVSPCRLFMLLLAAFVDLDKLAVEPDEALYTDSQSINVINNVINNIYNSVLADLTDARPQAVFATTRRLQEDTVDPPIVITAVILRAAGRITGGLLVGHGLALFLLLVPLVRSLCSCSKATSATAASANASLSNDAVVSFTVAWVLARVASLATSCLAMGGSLLGMVLLWTMHRSPADSGSGSDNDIALLFHLSNSHTLPQTHTAAMILFISGVAAFLLSSASLLLSFCVHPIQSTIYHAQSSPQPSRSMFPPSLNNSDSLTTPLLPQAPAQSQSLVRTTSTDDDSTWLVNSVAQASVSSPASTNNRRLLDTSQLDEETPLTSTQQQQQQQQDNTNTDITRIQGTRRLLQVATQHSQIGYLHAGIIVLLIRLPFSLAMPHFVSTTLSALAQGDYSRAVHREILLLFAVGTIDALLDFWCIFLFGYVNIQLVQTVRTDLWSALLKQEVAFFDQQSSGSLSSRLQSDCSAMANDLTWFFRFSIESVVRILGITGYMIYRSPQLASCALCIIPVAAVINKVYGDWLAENAANVQDALSRANAAAQEALGNIRTVLAFAAEDWEWIKYTDRLQVHFDLVVKQLVWQGVYYMCVSTFLINTIVQGTLLWVGAYLIEHHDLTPQVLLAFMLYQSQLQNETLNLFQSYSSLIQSSGAGDKVFALLDRQPPPPATGAPPCTDIPPPPPPSPPILNSLLSTSSDNNETASVTSPSAKSTPSRATRMHTASSMQKMRPAVTPSQKKKSFTVSVPEAPMIVQFSNVTFAYPTRPSHCVLDSFQLEVRLGQTVALVGSSGVGKSTVMHLLQRFYDPQEGHVFIEGVDLKYMDVKDHRRRNIGIVTQEPVLMDGTILENILYGCPGALSHEDSWRAQAQEAAVMAHADGFIQSFPDKYDTPVGERGLHLSGGQKQRIALARALVKHPRILLLDEATSALDHESEQAVQHALDQLLRKKRPEMTTLIIAHRLRTVQYADKIAVMHEGKVVEWGSHAELLQMKNGRYHSMVERRAFASPK
jgi:ABC-type multidrug transport system fused ATPase/permease subunit